MLAATKSLLFEKIFEVYNCNLIKRRFNSLQVVGLQKFNEKLFTSPFVIYVNHSSWWDGLIAFELSREIKLDSFIMMEEKNLKSLPLFRKLGAFSINKDNAREALNSLDYAVSLLQKAPPKTLWIFPQGEILPNDIRPLLFYTGISRILKNSILTHVVPIAIRFEFLGNYKPDIFVKIGDIEDFSGGREIKIKETSQYLAEKLTINLDQLKREITSKKFERFQRII